MMAKFREQAERFADADRDRRHRRRATSRKRPFTLTHGEGTEPCTRTPSSSRPAPRRTGWASPNEQRLAQHGRRRLGVRGVRRRAARVPQPAPGRGRRRRHRDGGGALPHEVRDQGDVIHRRDEFRASKIMQDRAARRTPRSRSAWNSQVADVLGDEFIDGVELDRHDERHEAATLPVQGPLHRDRPQAATPSSSAARSRPTTRATSCSPDRGSHDDEHRRRLRRGRRRRQGLPPGRHRRRHRLHGRARRRALARPRGHPLTSDCRRRENGREVPLAGSPRSPCPRVPCVSESRT